MKKESRFILLIVFVFVLAPAYLVRFSFFGLPANLLMLWVFALWAIWIGVVVYQNRFAELLSFFKKIDKKMLAFVLLFLLSGIISLFIENFDRAKLGQFIVLFLQPISLFVITAFHFNHAPQNKNYLLLTAYFLLAISGLYAIVQYFTLTGLPAAYWGNANEPKRALSFFIHPNFYALWSAPLLALLIPDLRLKINDFRKNWHFIVGWIIGALGLMLSFSRAGWLGLAAAIFIYAVAAGDKKIRKLILYAIIVIVIVIVSVPNLRWRFVLPFYKEKSAVSRLSLWHTGIKAIKESPVFGLGLTGFGNNWQRLNTDPNLDTHNFPHNLFLDLWVKTGLIGLISLIGLIGLYIYRGLKDRQNLFKLSVSLFLIALLFQGLIDNPYFKNDLAMVFWIVLSLSLSPIHGESARTK